MEAEVVGLAVYLYIYMFICWCWQKQLFICSFVRKNVRCFHCLAGNSAVIRSTSPTLFNT